MPNYATYSSKVYHNRYRDRRNNILLHGLPYQVQGQKEQHTPPRSTIPGTGTGGTTYSSMVYHTRYRDRRNNILLHGLLDPRVPGFYPGGYHQYKSMSYSSPVVLGG